VIEADAPEIAPAVRALDSARGKLARLAVGGAAGEHLDSYQGRLSEARVEVDAAERLVGTKSSAFRQNRARGRTGLAQVLEALPADAALVAFSHYDRTMRGSIKTTPSYIALV